MGLAPRISIVMPCLNCEAHVEDAITSVLSQEYPNLQFIVMDGGSRDHTRAILQRYHHDITCLIGEPDRGPAHALNKGFARADGQIWAYLSSEDRYVPGALREVAELFTAGHGWIAGAVRDVGGQAPAVRAYMPETCDEDALAWFFADPVPLPGAFWSGRLGRAYGPLAQVYRYAFAFDFFLRLRFQANVQPVATAGVVAEARRSFDARLTATRAQLDEELARCRYEFLAERADLAKRVARRRRHMAADWLQALALQHGREGRSLRALREMLSSVRLEPQLAWRGRTVGALKRILLARGRPGRQTVSLAVAAEDRQSPALGQNKR